VAELKNTFSSSEKLALVLVAHRVDILTLEAPGKGEEVVGEVTL
jgi:hypothetical protein